MCPKDCNQKSLNPMEFYLTIGFNYHSTPVCQLKSQARAPSTEEKSIPINNK